MASDDAGVRYSGIELAHEICSRLPFSALHDNLPALSIGIFSILENNYAKIDLQNSTDTTLEHSSEFLVGNRLSKNVDFVDILNAMTAAHCEAYLPSSRFQRKGTSQVVNSIATQLYVIFIRLLDI